MHVAVVAARAFGARAEHDDLAVVPLRQQIGDALERDFCAAIDAMKSGKRDADSHFGTPANPQQHSERSEGARREHRTIERLESRGGRDLANERALGGHRDRPRLAVPAAARRDSPRASRGEHPTPARGPTLPGFPASSRAGLATPQLLAIIVQDATVERGALVAYVAEPGDRLEEDWIRREGHLWARVVGARPERIGAVRHVQRIACFVGRRLDRRQLDDPAAYRLASNAPTPPSLRRIWRKSAPFGVNDPHRQTESPFRHTLYLELARTLEPDEQLSVVLPDGLGALPFVNDSRRNRSESLHVNQHGWRAADPSKRGFLAFWLPGGPDYGLFDIGAALVAAGLDPRFEIIAASGEAVFSGPIELRKSPVGLDAAGRYDFYESLYDGSVEIVYDDEPTSRIQPPEGEFWRSQGFTRRRRPRRAGASQPLEDLGVRDGLLRLAGRARQLPRARAGARHLLSLRDSRRRLGRRVPHLDGGALPPAQRDRARWPLWLHAPPRRPPGRRRGRSSSRICRS